MPIPESLHLIFKQCSLTGADWKRIREAFDALPGQRLPVDESTIDDFRRRLESLESSISAICPISLVEESAKLDDVILNHIIKILNANSGKALVAADVLGIGKMTLYRFAKKNGIQLARNRGLSIEQVKSEIERLKAQLATMEAGGVV